MPHRLHHVIANAEGGNYLRNLRNRSKVTVDHDGQPRPPRPEARIAAVAHANMPFITDDSSNAPTADPADHTWETHQAVGAADADDPTIPWILRSSDAAAVAKAKASIEAAMTDAEQSATGFLILPDARMNRYVIGPQGQTINEIRHATGCKIDVPKAATVGQAIQIRGSVEGIDQAKDAILDAVVAGTSRGGR